ncbi:MAG: ECF transporter S component [Bacilli bacterium]|nr:ECF transporter S component [Bacilli bacterium]
MKRREAIIKLSVSAMLLAIGLVLPFLTGQVPEIGSMLLPMHIPVLICGIICGWQWGLSVGFILPLLRSVLFTMPPFYPTAIAMAFELATYGAISGLIYSLLGKKTSSIYISLLSAMLVGRVIWGVARVILLGFSDTATFTWAMFIAGAFTNALPGIILQIILIPIIVIAIDKINKNRSSRYEKEKNTSYKVEE